MAEVAIPVDIFNPGQVFACLGLLETSEALLGEAKGGFDWNDEANVRFRLDAAGKQSPVAHVLRFLAKATVSSCAPALSEQSTVKWGVPTTRLAEDAPFPFPDPPSPATLPALIHGPDRATITIDHWGEHSRRTGRDAVKFWAGSGGYPGAALAVDALNLVRNRIEDAVDDPFSLSVPQSSYIPMDVGFSPNDHSDLTMVGFPLVELLAAIGLENARPARLGKLAYRYGIIGISEKSALVAPIFHRAALGGAELPFPERFFQMRLGWPGQENQARCIIDVIEENRL
jgi:CRISPR-associated protein Csx14